MSSPKETKKIKLSQKKLDILKKHAQKQKTKPNVTADEKETKKIKLSPEAIDILKKHASFEGLYSNLRILVLVTP